MRGIKETQKLKLGDAQGAPSKYSKDTQASKLGDAPVGIPPFFFDNYQLVSVDPKFLLLHMMFAILIMSFYFVRICLLLFRTMFCIFYFNKSGIDSLCHAYFASIHVAV